MGSVGAYRGMRVSIVVFETFAVLRNCFIFFL